jgi:uncharacterized repeat protein (TIGR03803 family)
MRIHCSTSIFSKAVSVPMLASAVLILILATAGASTPAQAQTYKDIYNATGGNQIQNPTGVLAQGRDGNLYGASTNGGTFYGAIFKVTPGGKAKVINDIGYFPSGGVTLGTDGDFYGVDGDGGVFGNCGEAACGQVYKVTAAGKLTILHDFTNEGDGESPQSSPIEATNGIFYGTSNSTVYSVTSKGVFTTLHNFTGSDGTTPSGALVQGSDGNLYGETVSGGSSGDGVIYKITPSGDFSVLHYFTGAPDGSQGYFPLMQASDGNFYGVTLAGGSFYGIIFQLTPAGKYTVLHTFSDGPGDGAAPAAGLMQATDGKIYGVTSGGGTSNYGTIFSITTGGGVYSVIYSFVDATGANPSSPLRQNTNGLLYGETYVGGNLSLCGSGCGALYSLDLGLGPFVSLMTTSGAELSKVEILGQGFSKSGSEVKFGGVPATAVTVTGSTFITATVPAGAQSGAVTVTTGSTTLTSIQKFYVLPAVTSFSPASGPVGTPVTIMGSALTETTAVAFNGVAAKFTVNSDTQVTADVPTGATTGKITVTTPAGSASSKTSFKVK